MIRILLLSFSIFLMNCGNESRRPTQPTFAKKALIAPTLRADSALAIPSSYEARFRVDPTLATFSGWAKIKLNITQETDYFFLNGSGFEFSWIYLNVGGKKVKLRANSLNDHWIVFQADESFKAGKAILEFKYKGKVDAKNSFGIFRQKIGKEWYLYTQFEARGARRAIPSLDQPDIKTPWKLTLDVPKTLVGLTNTPQLSRVSLDNKWDRINFAQSKAMPSYLLAFAVGPFEMVSIGKTKEGTPVRIAAPKGRGEETSWVVESTLKLIDILEDYTQIPYPYAKLDLVSVPSTGSFSAMENPGLITYSERFILSKDNHLSFKQAYVSIGAHELAHQWFGNLVTNAWWDDLWLNESFATWAAAKVAKIFDPTWQSELSLINQREHAMHADRLSSARVIRQPIAKDEDIGLAFDGITYAKGASILLMFENWLGTELFAKGIHHYLSQNRWKSVQADDFLAAMDDATDTNMSASFRRFIQTPGTPLVHFSLTCEENKQPILSLTQERYRPLSSEVEETTQYLIPICIRYPLSNTKDAVIRKECKQLEKKSLSWELPKAKQCPNWIIPNAMGTGYYRSKLSKELASSLWKVSPMTSVEQMVLAGDLKASVLAGHTQLDSLLTIIAKLSSSKDDLLVAIAIELADLGTIVKAKDKKRYARWLQKRFSKTAKKMGWKTNVLDSQSITALRQSLLALMIFEAGDTRLAKQGKSLAKKWFQSPKKVPADLTALALRVGARYADTKLLERYINKFKDSESRNLRRMLLLALGETTKTSHIKKVLAIMLDESFDIRETSKLFKTMGANIHASSITLEFLKENFKALAKRYGLGMQSKLLQVIDTNVCREEDKTLVLGLLNENFTELAISAKSIAKKREAYHLCLTRNSKVLLPKRF